jgi:uncharacterized protein
MLIRVDEIPEAGRTLRFHWDQEKLEQFVPPDDPFGIKLSRPINVVLDVNRRTDHIRVEGRIEGALDVTCHRCLSVFSYPIDERVDVYLVEEDPDAREDEKELEADELLHEFFDGEVIDIDQLVAEQIFLSLPVKVLCSEECKGICPRCGVNLNEEACRCKSDAKGSPFTKLASIKAGLPGFKTDER